MDEYFSKIIGKIIKKSKNQIFINLSKFNKQNSEVKLMIVNNAIKEISNSYYSPRSKKVLNLIKNIQSNKNINATLNGCLFSIYKDQICVKKEKK